MFTSGDYTHWLVSTKNAIIGWYTNTNRGILKSSANSNPHVAKWYRRNTSNNIEDPWVSLQDYPNGVIYGANSISINQNPTPVLGQGGAKVFIRDSS